MIAGARWEDPPEPTAGRGARVWYERLAPLMERPGVWARIDEGSPGSMAGVAAQLRGKRLKNAYNLPPGRWDATVRTLPDVGSVLFVRYLGPEAAA